MKFTSIKTQILLSVAVIVIAVTIFSTIFVLLSRKKEITKKTEGTTEQLIDYTYQVVNLYVSHVQISLESLAQDPAVIEAAKTHDEEALQIVSDKMTATEKVNPVFENMSFFDTNCVLVTGDSQSKSLAGRDFSQRDYCNGIKKSKSTYVSEVIISAVTKHPVVALATPVKDENGEMIGFLAGGVNLLQLQPSLTDLQHDTHVILLDRYGKAFINTEEQIVEIKDATSNDSHPEAIRVAEELTAGKTNGFFDFQEKEKDSFVGFKKYEYVTVILTQPEKQAFSLLYSAVTTQIAYGILVIALTIGFVWLALRKIVNRLKEITVAMDKVSKNELDTPIDKKELDAVDEIGDLARAFNRMRVSVKILLSEES